MSVIQLDTIADQLFSECKKGLRKLTAEELNELAYKKYKQGKLVTYIFEDYSAITLKLGTRIVDIISGYLNHKEGDYLGNNNYY
jgi:hypothetical protein